MWSNRVTTAASSRGDNSTDQERPFFPEPTETVVSNMRPPTLTTSAFKFTSVVPNKWSVEHQLAECPSSAMPKQQHFLLNFAFFDETHQIGTPYYCLDTYYFGAFVRGRQHFLPIISLTTLTGDYLQLTATTIFYDNHYSWRKQKKKFYAIIF